VDETRVLGKNHRPVGSHWQILSHNILSSTPRIIGIRNERVSEMGQPGQWKWARDDIFCLLLFRNPQKMSFTSWHFQNVSPRIVQDHAFGSMSRQVRRWHYTFVCRKNWCSVLNYKAYVYELKNYWLDNCLLYTFTDRNIAFLISLSTFAR
jgi:hypothetical protein